MLLFQDLAQEGLEETLSEEKTLSVIDLIFSGGTGSVVIIAILFVLLFSALYVILPETKPSKVDLKVLDYKKTITLVILMILYGLTILRVGYFLSTSIFLVLSYIVLGERKWIWIFILSFPFVALFMYLLHGLLNIYLRDPFLQLIGIMG